MYEHPQLFLDVPEEVCSSPQCQLIGAQVRGWTSKELFSYIALLLIRLELPMTQTLGYVH